MAINLNVNGNTAPLEAAVQAAVTRIRRTPIKITVDDKGATQPLGNMKRGADEFSKSMEAANARIIAFGASMAIINGVSDAFKAMVKNVVEVEKSLADINVVMGLSANNLDKFSSSLFKVAKETGAAFNVAAEAATEYARQGLAVEETLKRTQDALILTRLTGMDSANAVKALTAAMNTYGDQIKDTTQLVSKFAAVDVKFAVSAEDFADAISRTGQAAKSAGVDIDELVGLVTAAQQKTARGGKVIGNSFKTIFTRIGRTDTLNQLENLGIAVRDVEGKTIGAKRILTDLANTFDHLTESQKAQIAQTVGGVFQINVLKAVLSDAAKQNGILANATQISAGATDEAITKNEQLRQTMAAMATETGLALKEMSASVGELMLAPGMEKILNIVKSVAEGANDMLGGGEASGNSFAKGFLKGVGNIITGPGLVVIVAVFTKLLVKAVQYARESLSSLIGVTSEAQKQKAIQTSLVNLFGQNAALNKEMLRTDISRTEKEKIILGLLKAQVVEANLLNTVAKSSASNLYRQGYGANLAPRKGRAGGHIPNFANPERAQAAKGGYAAGSIRSMNMPGEGSVIYNSAETVKNFAGFKQPAIMPPHSSKAGKNYQQAFGNIHGFDPYAAGGYIPNFARMGLSNAKLASKIKRGEMTVDEAVAKGYTGGLAGKNVSRTSDLKNQRFKHLNPMGQEYVVLVASEGQDSPAGSYFVGNKKMGGNRAYKYASAFKNKKGVNPAKVDVPFYSLDARDKDLNNGKNSPYRNTIYNGLKESGEGLIGKILRDLGFSDKVGKRDVLTDRDVSAMGGNVFEGVIASVLSDKNFDNYKSRGETARIDLPRDDDLYRLFGVKGGSLGAEAKITSGNHNIKDAALKFYDMLTFGGAGQGFIPNFANPLSDAIGREKEAGVPVSKIRIGSHSALMNKSNPIGLGVTNTDDEPNGLKDVFGAANGFVPNYVNPFGFVKDKIVQTNFAKQMTLGASNLEDFNKKLRKHKKEQQKHSTAVSRIEKQLQRNLLSQKEIDRLNKQLATAKKHEAAASRRIASTTRGTGVGGFLGRSSARMGGAFGGNSGMMMMMGAPMAAGFLQRDGAGQTGAGGTMYSAGGALQGAASGAMMASMLAPIAGPFSPLVIALGALGGGIYGAIKATEENSKALDEARKAQYNKAASASTSAIGLALSSLPSQTLKGFSGELEALMQGVNPKNIEVDQTLSQINLLQKMLTDPSVDQKQIQKISSEQATALGLSAGSDTATVAEIAKGAGKIKKTIRDAQTQNKTLDPEGVRQNNDFIKAQQKTLNDLLRGLNADLKITSQGESKNRLAVIRRLNLQLAASKIQEKINKDLSSMKISSQKSLSAYSWLSKFGIQGNEIVKNQIKFSKAIDEVTAEFDRSKFKAREGQSAVALQKISKSGGDVENGIKNFLSDPSKMSSISGVSDRTISSLETMKLIDSDYTEMMSMLNFDQILQILGKLGEADSNILEIKKQLEENYRNEEESLKNVFQEKVSLLRVENKINDKHSQRLELQKSITREISQQNKFIQSQNTQNELSIRLGDARFKNANQFASKQEEILQKIRSQKKTSEESERQASGALARDYADKVMSLYEKMGAVPPKELIDARSSGDISRVRSQASSEVISPLLSSEKLKTALGSVRSKMAPSPFVNPLRIQELQEVPTWASGKQERDAEISQLMHIQEEDQKRINKLKEEESKINKLLELSNAERKKIAVEILRGVEEDIAGKERILNITKKINEEEGRSLKNQLPGGFSKGFRQSKRDSIDRLDSFDENLTREMTDNFRNGLVDGMQAAINKADDLSDVMNNIAMNFLGAIQKAYLGKAADAIVGALPFSSGGGVRKYSRGGGVPAMVTNGEYVMGKEAVNRYGGGFMHRLNAGGKLPGYSTGGGPKPGSALAANFGGGEGYATGRRYQSQAMSGFFYSGQAGNVGLQEDTQYTKGIIRERMRKEAEKKAKKRALMQMIVGTALSVGVGALANAGIGAMAESGALGGGAQQKALFNAAPEGTFGPMDPSSARRFGGFSARLNQNFGGDGSWSWNKSEQDGELFRGGRVGKYANGGHIAGKSGIDQIPAMLSEGEYVIRASSARQLGKPMLDRINAGKFNEGGAVTPLIENSETGTSGGNTNNINVTVNMQRGKGKSEEKDSSSSGGTNPKDASAEEERTNHLAEKVKEQVITVIMEEQRPGGLLSD